MGRLSLVFAILLMVSAISLVTSRHQSRQLFIELDRQVAQARDLDVEWRRLQVDRAEHARNARVDEVARGPLKMVSIVPNRTMYLRQDQLSGGGQ